MDPRRVETLFTETRFVPNLAADNQLKMVFATDTKETGNLSSQATAALTLRIR